MECKLEGCHQLRYAKKLCNAHYARQYRGCKNERPLNALIPCAECGNEFIAKTARSKYCSRPCAMRYWRKNNPERRSELNRKHLLLRYGINQDQYDGLLIAQNGRCAICKLPPKNNGRTSSANLHVDHCHKTGKIRGLLCTNCNTAIGLLKDSKETLCSAIKYLI